MVIPRHETSFLMDPETRPAPPKTHRDARDGAPTILRLQRDAWTDWLWAGRTPAMRLPTRLAA